MIAFFMEGKPSGGVYFTSPLVNLAAEARIAVMGVLFFGSPIPKLNDRLAAFAQEARFFVQRKGRRIRQYRWPACSISY